MIDYLSSRPLVNVLPDAEGKALAHELKRAVFHQTILCISVLIWRDFTSVLWCLFSGYFVWTACSDRQIIRTQSLATNISAAYFVLATCCYDFLLPVTFMIQSSPPIVHFEPSSKLSLSHRSILILKSIHYFILLLVVTRFLYKNWTLFHHLHTSPACKGIANSSNDVLLPFLRKIGQSFSSHVNAEEGPTRFTRFTGYGFRLGDP